MVCGVSGRACGVIIGDSVINEDCDVCGVVYCVGS